MRALKDTLKKVLGNLAYTLIAAAVLTCIGWCLTIAILETGGFTLCFFLVAALIIIEIFNMQDILNTKKASNNDLALATLFLNASMVAHFACAAIFINYLLDFNAVADKSLDHIPIALFRILSVESQQTTMLQILLILPLVRFATHCWYIIRLLLQKRYFPI